MKIHNHYSHWLPKLIGYHITLGNHIFYATDNPPQWLRNHEETHVRQFAREGVLVFLLKYLLEYFLGRLNGKNHSEAYEAISFEVEATANE